MSLEVRRLICEPRRFLYGAFNGDPVVPLVKASGATPREALERLVKGNYDRVRRLVFERAAWRCEQCRKIKPLQCDHIKLRSHGRLDVIENLQALCCDCHEKKHSALRRVSYERMDAGRC